MAVTDLVTTWGFVTYQGSGYPLLDATIVETINRTTLMQNYKDYASKLDFTMEKLLNPSQTFTAKAGPKAMENVLETGNAKLAELVFTPKKGIDLVEVGNKYSRSDFFTKWALTAKNIAGANDSIQAELALSASEIQELTVAYDLRYAEELLKNLTLGFTITGWNGPGWATPKGKALFDTHNYGVPWSAITWTFTNFTNGALTFTSSSADILAGTTRLQTLINQLKQARDENGKFVPQWDYKLFVSRQNSVFWKQVLNDNSNFSGQGSNANQLNQFNFKWNIVELVVLDLLGTPWYDGTAIGTVNMIFVSNSTGLKQARAFKNFNLQPLDIQTWKDMWTRVLNTDARAKFGSGHYWAELYIAGSTNA